MEGAYTFSETPVNINNKQISVYDSDTGLIVKKLTGYNNGVEGTPTEYAITLVSDSGGVKTYKRITGDGEYEVYKIQNGRILETELKISYGHYTLIYTLPDNNVIRSKLPDFKLEDMKVADDDGGLYRNKRQTVAVVSDTDSVLVIRVKEETEGYDKQYTLTSQTDYRHEKFSMPFSK